MLVASATGAHRGELIGERLVFHFIIFYQHQGHVGVNLLVEDWSFVLLYSNPPFITQTSKCRHPTEPYKLRALPPGNTPLHPPSGNATVLCHVRALKAYLTDTADPEFVNS